MSEMESLTFYEKNRPDSNLWRINENLLQTDINWSIKAKKNQE